MSLMKKLTSLIVTSSLVLGLVGTSFAAFGPEAVQEAADRMVTLGLVQGMPGGDLALNSNLTRAQLVTIIVRAYGQEDNAKLMVEAPTKFPDVAGHWASGYIWMANSLITQAGHSMGMPDGTFNPDGNVTVAEAVAFLLKFLGVPIPANTSWPDGYLQVAAGAGLVSAADAAMLSPILNSPATRGMAFWMSDSAFYNYNLADGKTVYTKYVSKDMPSLTVDAVAATTTATSVTITGTTDATTVYVGSMDNMALLADGAFSADVDLAVGPNDIVVHAISLAGNHATKTVKVTRTAGAAATIDAPATLSVAAGATADLAAMVKDANGAEVADAAITASGTIGTWADGKFTAATTAGTGNLTLTSGDATATVAVTVTAGAMTKVEVDKPSVAIGEKATLTAKDQYGNAVTGATFSVSSADALVSSAGAFIGSASGNYTVTATAGDATATVVVGVYGDTTKLVVSGDAQYVANLTVGAGNAYVSGKLYEVTVQAQDANGNLNRADNTTSFNLTGSGLIFYSIDSAGNTGAAITSGTVTKGVLKFRVGAPTTIPGRSITLTADTAVVGVSDGTLSTTTVFPVATKLKIAGISSVISTNSASAVTATVTVLDQTDTTLASGNYTGTATVSGPATVTDSVKKSDSFNIINGSGTFVLNITQGQVGDISVTAAVDGLGSAVATSKAVIAGPAANLKVAVTDSAAKAVTEAKVADGTSVYTYTISAVDAQGAATSNNLPTGNYSVSFGGVDVTGLTFGGGATYSSTTKILTVPIVSGVGSFTVVSSTYLGALTATASKTNYTSASAGMTFKAGSASKVALTTYSVGTVKYNLPVDNPVTTATAQLTDSQGNAVAQSGVKLTFKAVEGFTTSDPATSAVTLNGTAGSVTVETDAAGKATVDVSARKVVGVDYTVSVAPHSSVTTVTITAGQDALSFKVTDRIATSLTVDLLVHGTTDIATTVNPDTTNVNVRVRLKDQYGTAVTGQAAYLSLNIDKVVHDGTIFINNKEIGGATYKFLEDGSTGTYWLVPVADVAYSAPAPVKVAKAGLQNIGAKYSGVEAGLTSGSNINVLVGAKAALKVLESGVDKSGTTIATTVGTVYGPLTLQMTDQFGNAVSSSLTTVNVTAGTIRTSPTGAETVSLQTASAATFYVAVPADKTVTFDDGTHTVTITFDVP